MAYSDVAIICGPKAFDVIKEAYTRVKLEPQELYQLSNGSVIVKWNWIKWNGWYEDIQVIDDAIERLRDKVDELPDGEEFDYAYHFIRDGDEGMDDYEERSNPTYMEEFDGFGLERHIVLPEEVKKRI